MLLNTMLIRSVTLAREDERRAGDAPTWARPVSGPYLEAAVAGPHTPDGEMRATIAGATASADGDAATTPTEYCAA